jgi:hypothetical protein
MSGRIARAQVHFLLSVSPLVLGVHRWISAAVCWLASPVCVYGVCVCVCVCVCLRVRADRANRLTWFVLVCGRTSPLILPDEVAREGVLRVLYVVVEILVWWGGGDGGGGDGGGGCREGWSWWWRFRCGGVAVMVVVVAVEEDGDAGAGCSRPLRISPAEVVHNDHVSHLQLIPLSSLSPLVR